MTVVSMTLFLIWRCFSDAFLYDAFCDTFFYDAFFVWRFFMTLFYDAFFSMTLFSLRLFVWRFFLWRFFLWRWLLWRFFTSHRENFGDFLKISNFETFYYHIFLHNVYLIFSAKRREIFSEILKFRHFRIFVRWGRLKKILRKNDVREKDVFKKKTS